MEEQTLRLRGRMKMPAPVKRRPVVAISIIMLLLVVIILILAGWHASRQRLHDTVEARMKGIREELEKGAEP